MSPLHEQDFLWTPKVKDRPRAQPGGGRSYTPKKTVTAEAAFLEQYTGPTFEQMLAVEYDFYNDHVTMRVFEHDDYAERKLRGDVDNYLKLVTDALNTHAWLDDRQIVRLVGEKQ